MNDAQAERVLLAAQALALSVRDDGLDGIHAAAQEVLNQAGGDPVAALVVTAALIDIDKPTSAWWQEGLAGVRGSVDLPHLTIVSPIKRRARTAQHGTRGGFMAHRRNNEGACDPCRQAESAYQSAYHQRRKATA